MGTTRRVPMPRFGVSTPGLVHRNLLDGALDLGGSGANPKLEHRPVNWSSSMERALFAFMIGCGISTARQSRVPVARNTRLSCHAPIIEARFVSRRPKPNLIGYQTRLLASTQSPASPPAFPRKPSSARCDGFPVLTGWESSALRRLQTVACRCCASGQSSGPSRSPRRLPGAATGQSLR